MIDAKLLPALLLLGLICPGTSLAQRGDKPGEVQTSPVPSEKIPPAPPLSSADALRQFHLAPGFRIEAVAAEPMVENPIVLQFDGQGRLWVVEMRGYMPDAEGHGETNPVGRISILTDTDHDGR